MTEIYIRVDKATNLVEFMHLSPFDPVNGLGMTRDDLLKEGHLIAEYPAPEQKEGFRAVPYYNSDNNSVYFKYTVIPLSTDRRLDLVEKALNSVLFENNK